MPTDKKDKAPNLEDPKEMRRLMTALRDSIQNYLDNIDIEAADKKAKKEKK